MLLKNLPLGARFVISEDSDSVTFFKPVSSAWSLLDLIDVFCGLFRSPHRLSISEPASVVA
jgi:hypothetical protein